MNGLKAKLIGELIGLARATDGNEHLISARSTAVIRECLAASPDTEDALNGYLSRVEAVKREMVPDCFLCANPCGRTAAFDLTELESLPSDLRAAKYRILDALLCYAPAVPETALYRGLVALGMDGLSSEFLNSIADELAR